MADRNGNENCLEGLECPNCSEHKKLLITALTRVEIFDDGSGEHEDLEYDEESHVDCPSCVHGGKLKEFEIAEDGTSGQDRESYTDTQDRESYQSDEEE